MHGRSFAGKWCILTLCLFIIGTAGFANAASVTTDTTDYPPGGLVTITGAGYLSGEQVKVQVSHADGTPSGGVGHDPWYVSANSGGGFVTYWIVPYDDNTGEQLLVTATGQSSSQIATTTFWDNIQINLDQLQNGQSPAPPPEWANGNINSSNSCYSEGNSVPYRYFVEGSTGGSSHYFTVQMEWTKGGKHAFDYITQYDLSEWPEIATAGGPCGSPSAPPGDCATPTGSFSVPNPLTLANYTGSIPSDFFTTVNPSFALDGPGNILFYNATIDSVSKYQFGGSPSDRTLEFKIYFKTTSNGSVGFFWGGHLASSASSAWGTGNGSASVSGAPFHMRTMNFDGGGGANQDRSVQNGSLCLPPTVSLTCSVMDTVCQNSSYTCSVGAGAGSYSWSITGGTITSGAGTNSITYLVTSGSGSVTIIAEACNSSTACSGSFCCASDTVIIPINTAPVATNPPATVDTFMCASAQICRQFTATDANALTWTKISGSGTVSASGLWCFTPATSGSYSVVAMVSDGCASDTVSMTYNVTINSAPVAVNPPSVCDTFMCAGAQICRQFSATDVNGGTLTWTKLTGSGTVSSTGLWCFTASATGSYSISATVTDACGAKDTVSMTYNVTINSAPVATNPPASIDTSICASAQICRQFSVTDVNGGTLTWTLISGSGTVSSTGLWCFTASATGSYCVTASVADQCGAKDTVTMCYNVTVNVPPVATNPPSSVDTTLCAAAQICRQFSATDANGNPMTWTILSGSGTVSSSGLWCFTANASGSYCVSATVADPCGSKDTVTMCYNVTINSAPVAVNPPASADTFLCAIGTQICRQFSATDANGNGLVWTIISGSGTVSSTGLWCFTANATGLYCVTAKVTDPCGAADTITTCYNVTSNSNPVAANPANVDTTLCNGAGQICRQFSATDANGNGLVWTIISGSGTVSTSGLWCFDANTSGSYCVSAYVADPCGARDTVSMCYNVTVNVPPVATNPPATVDTFMCAAAQICRQFSATDANGNGLTWALLTGSGTVSASGLWCFTPVGSGSYCVTAAVSDPCGKKDTVSICYNVTINSSPVATNPPATVDTFVCATGGQVCRQFSATDANGNGLTWSILTGTGTVSASGQWCFTITGAGSYCVTAAVADPCGAKDTVAICYNVTVNVPPVATNPPASIDTFICNPGQICRQFSATDANGNGLVWALLSGNGTVSSSGLWCFNANASGTFCVSASVTDPCGAKDTVSMCYKVTVNQPPVISSQPGIVDTSICAPGQICRQFFATDPNGNGLTWTKLSGDGTIFPTTGLWCFDANASGSVTVTATVADPCGAKDTITFTYNVTVNVGPTVNLGNDQTFNLCNSQQLCISYAVSDPNGLTDILKETVISAPVGTIVDTAQNKLCFTPTQSGTYTFIVEVEDKCHATGRDTATLTVTVNKPPTVAFSVESSSTLMCYGQDSTICVSYTTSDPESKPLTELIVSGTATLDTVANTVCVNSPGGGTYVVILEVTDQCGVSARDTVTIVVERELCCPSITIEKVHNAFQGQQSCVSITMQDGKYVQAGGFDLLVWYDYSALSPMTVQPGTFITNCRWEYFTYRFGATGNCGSGCPQGLIHIVAIAETNNGANHPLCFSPATNDTIQLASICFLVTSNATFECQYVPIRFFWTDCTDNALSNVKGDSLLVSDLVYDYDNPVPINNGNVGFPTFFGTQNYCLTNPGPGKPPTTSCIDFYNGGIDIVCADSIDGRGDVNLNEVENEIADAVLLSRYFVYGLGVFVKNVQGQIAASDVNADGFTLSVADLVYLIRVIIGDASPYAKLAPVVADVTVGNGTVSVDREMGAALVVVEGNQIPTLVADNMEMTSNFDGTSTRILVWSQTGETFSGEFLKVDGIVAYTEFGSPEGAMVTAKLVNMPTSYTLEQNYPNPFNPTTSISFTLPKATEWELGVYNVYGQQVGYFADRSEAGTVKVDWDASQFASGVYFYRLTAGEYSATKKMVLLK